MAAGQRGFCDGFEKAQLKFDKKGDKSL